MTRPAAEHFHAVVRGDARGPLPALARAGLWWARFPYAAGVVVRNRLFDSGLRRIERAGVPVVSVGNLTLGGTGKTPCVAWVARTLADAGAAVAVVSRGYGAAGGRNDEALVLEQLLPDAPHFQGADRAAVARLAVEEAEVDVIVLDDGFQHRRLHRDLDVVLVDATQPLADDYLFPRGLLREPVSALRRAGVVIVTRADAVDRDPVAARRVAGLERRLSAPPARAVHAPTGLVGAGDDAAPLDLVRGRPVLGFCGLGNPAAFRQTLSDLGATVVDWRAFPDHHPYTAADVAELTARAARLPPGGLALTTEKDSVKLRVAALGTVPLWAVRVGFRFVAGEAGVRAKVLAVLNNAGPDTG